MIEPSGKVAVPILILGFTFGFLLSLEIDSLILMADLKLKSPPVGEIGQYQNPHASGSMRTRPIFRL